jgi:8-oxoguanine deaminase
MRLWIKNPLAILAEGAAGGIVVEDTRIAELVAAGSTPTAPVDAVFDASRHVVLPGLINTHHHFYQTLTRAHPAAIDKPLFPWLQALYPIWARLTPEALRLASRLALTELLMSGATCVADHHYLFTDALGDAIDIEIEEAAALGIRIEATRGSMSLSQKDGGLPPDSVVQTDEVILADSERLLARYHDATPGAMVRISLAPCSPFSVTPALMRETAALAARHGCGLHTHLGETRDEEAFCLATFGVRPVDYLEDQGWLGPRTWLAHGVHFNDDEVDRLGAAGVGVSHCPTSNMILASGFCRTCELEAAGVAVGLGVDGSASNDASNLIEAVRHAVLLNRLTYGAERIGHLDALRWATAGSARCLGRGDIGAIAPGMEADLALYTLDELRFSGGHDPLAALVLCGATHADRVMVAGRWRMEDGMPVGIDVAALRHAHHATARALFA